MKVERVDKFDPNVISERLLEIYERTDDWLWFSTSLHPEFFNREEIKTKLITLAENGVDIRILLDPQVDVATLRNEVSYIFNLPNTEIRQSDDEIRHNVIADGEDFRLEKPHRQKDKGAPNLIVYDAMEEVFSEAYKEQFEDWWNSSAEV